MTVAVLLLALGLLVHAVEAYHDVALIRWFQRRPGASRRWHFADAVSWALVWGALGYFAVETVAGAGAVAFLGAGLRLTVLPVGMNALRGLPLAQTSENDPVDQLFARLGRLDFPARFVLLAAAFVAVTLAS